MNTLEAIRTRKSVRSYLPKAVEPEKVKTLAESGNMAAKAGKVFFPVITNSELLNDAQGGKCFLDIKDTSSVLF